MNIVKLSAAVMLLGLVMPGLASAGSTVTVDGILTAGEYTGNMAGPPTTTTSGSKLILWWNDHNSIYTNPPPATGPSQMNDLLWEINDSGASMVSLHVFVQVPTYARRMIWANGCKYKTGSPVSADCAALDPDGDQKYLDAYFDGSHHSDVDMKYDTQTGSEYFKLNTGSGSVVDIDWQDVDGNGLDDGFTWKTSREYLVDDTNICTTSLCLEFDRTSSLEVMWTGLESYASAIGIVNSITDMQLHLSDEARGLPPVDIPPIPLPAAFWLFGTALIGFIGISRRTNLS